MGYLRRLIASCSYNSYSEAVDYKHFRYYLESDINFNKPDYVAVLDLKNSKPILCYNNLNLPFLDKGSDRLDSIISMVSKGQLGKIHEADKLSCTFVSNHIENISNVVFKLRFGVSAQEESQRSLIRNLRFVPIKLKGKQHVIVVLTFSDVTDLLGTTNQPFFDFKYQANQAKGFIKKLESFKATVNKKLSLKHELTQRELQVLTLIGQGLTSQEVADALKISKNTVNTHRQNLIKKFNVDSTAMLLRELW